MKKTSYFSRLFSFTWMEAGHPNLQWDECLNLLMDKCKKLSIGEYYITFDIGEGEKIKVWIENHPYASGSRYLDGPVQRSLQCKTKTKIRLEDFVNNAKCDTKLSNLITKLKKQ